MASTMGSWRVWTWGVECGLGSHGQTKLSSFYAITDLDSKEEAKKWAEGQDKSTWGTWEVCQVGRSVVVTCEYLDIPKSYADACKHPTARFVDPNQC